MYPVQSHQKCAFPPQHVSNGLSAGRSALCTGCLQVLGKETQEEGTTNRLAGKNQKKKKQNTALIKANIALVLLMGRACLRGTPDPRKTLQGYAIIIPFLSSTHTEQGDKNTSPKITIK